MGELGPFPDVEGFGTAPEDMGLGQTNGGREDEGDGTMSMLVVLVLPSGPVICVE